MKPFLKTVLALLFAMGLQWNAQTQMFQPTWESLSGLQVSRLVQGCQIRHIYPLGFIFGSGIRKRMVSKVDV